MKIVGLFMKSGEAPNSGLNVVSVKNSANRNSYFQSHSYITRHLETTSRK